MTEVTPDIDAAMRKALMNSAADKGTLVTAPQIAEIAAKLTAAQRDAVRRGGIGDESMATVNALRRKGLMHLRIDSPDGRYGFMELTDLGTAVAAYLKEQSNGTA